MRNIKQKSWKRIWEIELLFPSEAGNTKWESSDIRVVNHDAMLDNLWRKWFPQLALMLLEGVEVAKDEQKMHSSWNCDVESVRGFCKANVWSRVWTNEAEHNNGILSSLKSINIQNTNILKPKMQSIQLDFSFVVNSTYFCRNPKRFNLSSNE